MYTCLMSHFLLNCIPRGLILKERHQVLHRVHGETEGLPNAVQILILTDLVSTEFFQGSRQTLVVSQHLLLISSYLLSDPIHLVLDGI